MANIDLSNFRVVKFYDPDIERNYINDILHAIVARIDSTIVEAGIVNSVRGDGTTTTVDSTDPSSPIVSAQPALLAAYNYADTHGVQTLVAGTNVTVDNTDPLNPIVSSTGGGVTYTDTGISITGGAKAGGVINPALATNAVSGICTSEYSYPAGGTDWQLWVYPTPAAGAFTLDVRKRVFGNAEPSALDTICATAYPTLTGNGSDITSTGSISTWTASPLLRGEMFTVAPAVNTALVTWWCLFIPARRVL